MTLTDFLDKYLNEHQLAPSTEEQYRYTLLQFERIAGGAGGSFRVQDIDAPRVNTYLRSLEAQGRSPFTVKGRRTNLLVLWRYARIQRLNAHPDDCVRRLRSQELLVEVWSPDEARRLKAVAESWIGQRHLADGTDEGLYWSAYIPAAWESSLRRGDLLHLPGKTIRPEFQWRQRKTGGLTKVELRPATIALIRRLEQARPGLACPLSWPHTLYNFSKHARALVREAGLHGTLKYLRRGSGTNIAQEHGIKAASQKLGHKDTAVTERHYMESGWDKQPSLLPEEL